MQAVIGEERLVNLADYASVPIAFQVTHVLDVVENPQGFTLRERRLERGVYAPDARGLGVGTALFRTAKAWAAQHGCGQLKVETQNINVPACRFYEQQGCTLRTARRGAYEAFPDEVQLLWYKSLVSDVRLS
jgi:GNAT superfamily N-acetyltransferase